MPFKTYKQYGKPRVLLSNEGKLDKTLLELVTCREFFSGGKMSRKLLINTLVSIKIEREASFVTDMAL